MTMDNPTEIQQVAGALTRIAEALEHLIPADPFPARIAPADEIADLPPVRPQMPVAPPAGDVCPIHQTPWKTVPAGVSKKTGNPYSAFQACSVQGCDQRPPR